MNTAVSLYNKKCSSIEEYQSAVADYLFQSRMSSPKGGNLLEASAQSRRIGAISLLKAHASHPIFVQMASSGTYEETSFLFHIQLRGEVRYTSRGGSVTCREGTILLINSKYLLAGEQLTCADAMVVKLPALFAREYSELIDRYCWIPKDGDVGSASVLRNFILNMWESSSGLNVSDCETLPKIFLNLLDAVYFSETRNNSRPGGNFHADLMTRLESEIIKKMGRPGLTVEELIADLCVSRSKLYRATAQAGTTVKRMIMDARLQRAKKLLSNDHLRRMSLTDIALEVGFCDQAHFSRSFKGAFGVSPSEYRKNTCRTQF